MGRPCRLVAYPRVHASSAASSVPRIYRAAVIHGIGRLISEIYVIASIHLELLTVHCLLSMGQLELGRSLHACRSHFFAKCCLREVGVGWQGPVQAISQSSTLVQMLVPRDLPRGLVQVLLDSCGRALAKRPPVIATGAHIPNLAHDSLTWKVVRAAPQTSTANSFADAANSVRSHVLREEVKAAAACVATILHRRIHRHSGALHRAIIHNLALAKILVSAHATACSRVRLHWIVDGSLLIEDRDTVLDDLRLGKLLSIVLTSSNA